MKNENLKKMILSSLFVALIAICSFITIPIPSLSVPITMQIFAIFLSTLVLKGKWGSIAIIVYLVLGCLGAPIFSGFKGGLGSVMGVTGGYLIGFIFIPISYLLFMMIFKKEKLIYMIIALIVGLFICYLFGSLWFCILYSKNTTNITFSYALMNCVVPFIIPDLIKLSLAIVIYKIIEPIRNKYLPDNKRKQNENNK